MSALELTGWIPCTTPPVRDGDYDLRHDDDSASPFRAEFRDGKWLGVRKYNIGDILDAVDKVSGYQWRGIRRWVLVRRAEPIMSALAGKPTDLYVVKRTPRKTDFGSLQYAIGFDTKEQAERYRYRGRPFGSFDRIEAVLP